MHKNYFVLLGWGWGPNWGGGSFNYLLVWDNIQKHPMNPKTYFTLGVGSLCRSAVVTVCKASASYANRSKVL